MGGKGSAGGGKPFTLGSGGGAAAAGAPSSGGRVQTEAEANRIRASRGFGPGGSSGSTAPRKQTSKRPQGQGATGEKSGRELTLPSGNKLNMSSLGSRAAGTTFGAVLGGFLAGGPGAAYGGYKGYQSSKEGWIGDAFNSRTGETYRDYLEKRGVSRKDTSLAAKHGVLEQGARDQGYRGSESVSLLDEGEDYDSITGEIF